MYRWKHTLDHLKYAGIAERSLPFGPIILSGSDKEFMGRVQGSKVLCIDPLDLDVLLHYVPFCCKIFSHRSSGKKLCMSGLERPRGM